MKSLAPRPTSLQPLIGSLRPSRIRSLLAAAKEPSGAGGPAPSPPPRRWPRAAAAAAALLVSMGVGVGARVLLGHGHDQAHHTRSAASGPGFKVASGGAHVRWHDDAVAVVLDDSLEKIDQSAPDVFSAALKAWRKSGAALPSVSTMPGQHRQPGYQEGGDNENVVVFAKYGWPRAGSALAVTVLTFEDNGKLLDADMVINGGGRFFEVYDSDDDSHDDGALAVAIDGSNGSTGSDSNADDDSDGRSRYDLQAVMTHELGHFFGLDEDYDDTSATMYIQTRPGEIHKRQLTQVDTSSVTALYAEAVPDDGTKKGCGGAAIAPSGSRGSSESSEALAAFGIAALGIVVAARARRSRWLSHAGACAAAAGVAAALVPPFASADGPAPRSHGDATAHVVAAETEHRDGLWQTQLRMRIDSCRAAHCPDEVQHAVVLGGTSAGVTQMVGGARVPAMGESVELLLDRSHRLVPLLTR